MPRRYVAPCPRAASSLAAVCRRTAPRSSGAASSGRPCRAGRAARRPRRASTGAARPAARSRPSRSAAAQQPRAVDEQGGVVQAPRRPAGQPLREVHVDQRRQPGGGDRVERPAVPPGRSSRAHSASTATSSSTCSRISPATHDVGAAVGQRHGEHRTAHRQHPALAAQLQPGQPEVDADVPVARAGRRAAPSARRRRRGRPAPRPGRAGGMCSARDAAEPVQHRELAVRLATTGRRARRTGRGRCAAGGWGAARPPAGSGGPSRLPGVLGAGRRVQRNP